MLDKSIENDTIYEFPNTTDIVQEPPHKTKSKFLKIFILFYKLKVIFSIIMDNNIIYTKYMLYNL